MKIGILSDTHLYKPDIRFSRLVQSCFNDCEIILHAGDLITTSILTCFGDKEVHAVHGNMCDREAQNSLPGQKLLKLGDFTIALAHGAGLEPDIEEGLWSIFPEADCIVYGHTHRPVCQRRGTMLFINPGSFTPTGRHGAAGTAAILDIDKEMKAWIFEVPELDTV